MPRFIAFVSVLLFVSVLSLAGLITFVNLQVDAQTLDHKLRGFNRFQLLIEDLDSDTISCGVTNELIRNAARYPASAAKFSLTEKLDVMIPTLYVKTQSFHFRGDNCVTYVLLRANLAQSVRLVPANRTVFANVELWQLGTLVLGGRSDHARRVTEIIEEQFKKFIADWNFDNREAD